VNVIVRHGQLDEFSAGRSGDSARDLPGADYGLHGDT